MECFILCAQKSNVHLLGGTVYAFLSNIYSCVFGRNQTAITTWAESLYPFNYRRHWRTYIHQTTRANLIQPIKVNTNKPIQQNLCQRSQNMIIYRGGSRHKKTIRGESKCLKENNRLLLEVRKVQKRAQMVKIVYWAIIIIIGIGAYFAVSPYFTQLESIYTGGQSSLDTINTYLDTFNTN